MAQQSSHVILAITAYFVSATSSLLWVIHRATPPYRHRTWTDLLHGAMGLWNNVLPSEAGVMAIIPVFLYLNFFVSALAMAAVITSAIFLGRLSVNESRRLSHRLVKYAVFKMVFVGSIITPDPRDIAVWLAWFSVIGYLRIFLGAAKDRLESLLIAPGSQLGRHARGVCLLVLVLVHNAASFCAMLRLLPRLSTARMLLCAFDASVVTIEGAKTLLRYVVHMVDRYMCFRVTPPPVGGGGGDTFPGGGAPGGGGWDAGGSGGGSWAGSKGSFLYHVELVADVMVHAVTLAHYLHVWVLHGLSFHIIDLVLFLDMRAVLLSLLRRLRSHLTYRAATHRINNTFPDVHPAALAAAGGGGVDCTICMDEIVHTAKQLPCGHVFHLSCLRAWLQQSGSETFTCPNCRQPILVGGGEGQQELGGGAGTGRLRDPAGWWLVGAVDRAYVRLVVAVEPLLLTLLLRWTLWLGGRAQNRRRVARSQPTQPREGFGESPGPPPGLRTSVAGRYPSESDLTAHGEDVYGGDTSDGCTFDGREDPDEEEGDPDRGPDEEEEEGHGHGGSMDADSDREASDPPYDHDHDGAEVEEEEVVEDSGEEARPEAGWRRAHPPHGAAGRRGCKTGDHCQQQDEGLGACLQSPRRRAGARWPGEHDATLVPTARGRAACTGCGCHGRSGRRPAKSGGPRNSEEAAAAAGAPGPSSRGAAAAAARLRSRRHLPPPAPEVPSYSGDVLARQAAAAARHLGRTVTASLRSSWGVGGVCAGAVAAGGLRGEDESDEEVCSRPRRVPTAARRRQRAAAGGGDAGAGRTQ